MKLRILGNSIRLRLTKPEIESIANNNEVCGECRFAPNSKLVYTIATSNELNVIYVEYQAYEILVLIPEDQAIAWAKGNEISLESNQMNGAIGGIKILIEKDFKCLVDRAEEDESDLFQNPNSQKS